MSSVILTTYFSKNKHPQFGDPDLKGVETDGRAKQNDISYIGGFYESVKNIGLETRIFYDNLTPEFVQKYTTPKIQFIQVEDSSYSYNDYRFFCYRNYLETHKFDSVFMTDSSDVAVVKDPAQILKEFPDTDYFVCKDSIKLFQFPYLKFHQQVGWENYMAFFVNQYEWDLINMGVIGGNYENIMLFLNTICRERIKIGTPAFNADIWTGNYTFRHLLSDKKLLIGEPFTSNFKKYEIERKDVYFVHK